MGQLSYVWWPCSILWRHTLQLSECMLLELVGGLAYFAVFRWTFWWFSTISNHHISRKSVFYGIYWIPFIRIQVSLAFVIKLFGFKHYFCALREVEISIFIKYPLKLNLLIKFQSENIGLKWNWRLYIPHRAAKSFIIISKKIIHMHKKLQKHQLRQSTYHPPPPLTIIVRDISCTQYIFQTFLYGFCLHLCHFLNSIHKILYKNSRNEQ